jgi:nucleotide-binding universal stress UspA family protein
MTFSKILVPYDFSDSCANAVPEVVVPLARAFGAEVVLLHVYEPPVVWLMDAAIPPSPERVGEQIEQLTARLEAARRRLFPDDLRATPKLVVGQPFVEIVREARAGSYDLVVIATHGHGGLRHTLIGSVAERVVRKAPCPVLTVRPQGQAFEHP